MPSKLSLPRIHRLRWEIGAALSIKILLLIGLWLLIFRWLDRPNSKPDIASHFALPTTPSSHFSQLNQEVRDVR